MTQDSQTLPGAPAGRSGSRPPSVRYLASALLCLVYAAAPAFAQNVVPIDALGLYGQIPSPPSTVLEAHGRAACANGGCDISRVYGHVEAEFTEVARQIELALTAAAYQAQPAASPAATSMQNMTDAEILALQQKVAAMSPEQQVAFAREMSRQSSSGAVALQQEPPHIQAALDAAMALLQATGQAATTGSLTPFDDRLTQLQTDAERTHAAIDAVTAAKVKATIGADGVPGPERESILVDAMQQHIAVEDAYLQAVLIAFRADVARQRARFAEFQEKLNLADYGADARNARTRQDLLTGQQMMLDGAIRLFGASRAATARGAEWWERKLETERNSLNARHQDGAGRSHRAGDLIERLVTTVSSSPSSLH